MIASWELWPFARVGMATAHSGLNSTLNSMMLCYGYRRFSTAKFRGLENIPVLFLECQTLIRNRQEYHETAKNSCLILIIEAVN